MREHNPATCRQCEAVLPDISRRHWMGAHKGPWHVIADGPDLLARLPRAAHYCTVLAYQPNADGPPAHYRGPCYAEWDSSDPAAVLAEVRMCLSYLASEYDCPLEAVRLWHSGGRGYHLTVPAVVPGAEAGHARLPRIYRTMVERLWPVSIAPSLDRGVYSGGQGRMWRLPNRCRPDNGRYKVPLAAREVLHRPHADLEALTRHPRHGLYALPAEDLSPCAGLVRLYEEVAATLAREGRSAHRAPGDPSGKPGLLYQIFAARGWVTRELAPGRWAVICPWTDGHTTGTPGDSSCVVFGPGVGEALGWWHCSHGHCAGRDLRDVLALFSPGELDRAREAAGLQTETGLTWKQARAQRLRTQAEETARRILARRKGVRA